MTYRSIEYFADLLRNAWQRSDQILNLIPDDAWFERPIGLRHPFLFYLGHLPAFAWNQACRGALGLDPLDIKLDNLFQRGIDPDSAEQAKGQSIHDWPTFEQTIAYRDAARQGVLGRIGDVLDRTGDELCEHGRVLQLVVEHEVMHQETLLYMIAECPRGMIVRPETIAPPASGEERETRPIRIPGAQIVIGAHWHDIPFGWDNEFGKDVHNVGAFEIDSLPVTNREWLDFYLQTGSTTVMFPNAWLMGAKGIDVKTVFGPVPFELAERWPAQVTGDQARMYCARRQGRLATEAEIRRAAYATLDGSVRKYPWGDADPSAEHGNFGFRHWFPLPVGSSPLGASALGVEELVGNGWEWTSSPFAPLHGFRPWMHTYPGYSSDFFDGAHDIVFGASWATDPLLVRSSFRNWYRRNYPYPFTSFRVVKSLLS